MVSKIRGNDTVTLIHPVFLSSMTATVPVDRLARIEVESFVQPSSVPSSQTGQWDHGEYSAPGQVNIES